MLCCHDPNQCSSVDYIRHRGLKEGRDKDGSIVLTIYNELNSKISFAFHSKDQLKRLLTDFDDEECKCWNHDLVPMFVKNAIEEDPPPGACWLLFFSVTGSHKPYLKTFSWKKLRLVKS